LPSRKTAMQAVMTTPTAPTVTTTVTHVSNLQPNRKWAGETGSRFLQAHRSHDSATEAADDSAGLALRSSPVLELYWPEVNVVII
jgi:hypothetical protein